MFIEVTPIISNDAKNAILNVLKKHEKGVVIEFIHHIDLALNRYKLRREELKNEVSQSDSNKELKKLIIKIPDITSRLNNLMHDPNLMHSFRREMLNSIIDRNLSYQKITWEDSPENQLITTTINRLNELEELFTRSIIKKSPASKGGRPSKAIRNIFIRDVAGIYKQHIGNPSQTESNDFEQVIKICFADISEVIEDIHKLVVNALKNHKVQ